MWITFCQGSVLVLLQECAILSTMQRLTKSKKLKRIRKHGFLVRMKSHEGQKTIKRRRDQGRKELAVSL